MLLKPYFWMMYKGVKNTELDIQVVQRPNIPSPTRRVEYIVVPGRDGSVTKSDGTYENIEFSVPFNYIGDIHGDFMHQTRQIKNWLSGSGELKFSDDNEVFYKVKDVHIDSDIERIMRRVGKFSALFTCDPYTYFDAGKSLMPIDQCLLNPYSLARPVYYITASDYIALTVNGYTSEILIDGNLVIDTDLMIMRKEDGTLDMKNSRVLYEKLYLKNGVNDISISDNAQMKIQPNWRWL